MRSGAIELLNIDCMEYMKTIPDKYFDLAIVDPPYGVDINMNMGRQKGKAKVHADKDWDMSAPDKAYFDELERVAKFRIIWGGNYFDLPKTKSWLFWDKAVPDGVSFAAGELAWTSGDKTLRMVKVPYSGFNGTEGKIHPTQKPVALYRWLLKNYAKEGDKILDTHLGSGSIALACHDYKFELTATDIDTEYFEATCKRFSNHVAQTSLF